MRVEQCSGSTQLAAVLQRLDWQNCVGKAPNTTQTAHTSAFKCQGEVCGCSAAVAEVCTGPQDAQYSSHGMDIEATVNIVHKAN